MSTTPSKAAAEIAANEYAFNMASEPEPTRTHFLNGFNQGVAWRPDVSEDVKGRAERVSDAYERSLSTTPEHEAAVLKHGHYEGYLTASADAAKRIAELEEACAAKDKAITEALTIIDEREAEVKRVKVEVIDFSVWAARYAWRWDDFVQMFIQIGKNRIASKSPDDLYELFRKETGR